MENPRVISWNMVCHADKLDLYPSLFCSACSVRQNMWSDPSYWSAADVLIPTAMYSDDLG